MKTDNNSKGKPQTRYIEGIDGLRAISVLMVVAYHLKLSFANGGLLGVTVFFVISGFLITHILLSEIERTNTIDLKNFWIRRIRRLLPAILTMVTVLIFVSAVFNRVLFTKACSELLSVIFGVNNWWQIFNNISYFENAGAPSPLSHCWSLSIETQFYIVYPLLLVLFVGFKNKKKLFAWVTVILAFISLGLMWILFSPSEDPSRVYYGTDTRAFSLLIGAFLALTIKSNRVKRRKSKFLFSDIIGLFSLVMLLYMMITIDGYSSFLYRGGQGIASVLAAFVLFSILNEKSILGKALSIYPLKWIGNLSYGIYLWHYPIILLISGGKKSAWWINLIEILLSFVFSFLSYYLIETPIRYGVIGKSIKIIKSHPTTRIARRKRIRTLNRSIETVCCALVIGIGVVLCIAFVPRESVLNNIEELEKQAENAKDVASQKAMQLNIETSVEEETDKQDSLENLPSDEEILQNLNLLLIGDSIALGATDKFYEVFPNSISDAAVSRYTTESFVIYDSYAKDNGWDGDGVIFALGSNGLLYDSLSTLREMIGTDRPFFIITAKAPYTSWEQSNNAEIYEFVDSTDNTYLIDWYGISEGHGEYFVEDETHLTSEGAEAYIDCIKNVVLQVYKGEQGD